MRQHPAIGKHRQCGGTVLGIVIGVVIGLGAALAVAVYVTKVPIPFMNRNAARSADQDAIEAQKNRDWNPNSGLAGKRGAAQVKPAGEDAASVPAPSGAAAGVTPPQAPIPGHVAPAAPPVATLPPTPAAPRSAPPSSADPLGDLARARAAAAPGAPSSPPPGNADAYDYLVQAGAFRTEADAETQRARLAIMGWEAKVSEREQVGRSVFRVRIGPFVRRDDAERLKSTLDGSGMETSLVRVQRTP